MSNLPGDWQLVKLNQLTTKVGSGITPKGGSAVYLSEGVPLIRSQNVLVGQLDLSDVVYISHEQHDRMRATKLQPRDVLLNITGASIGRCAITPIDFSEGNVNQHVCILRVNNLLEPLFLMQLLNSDNGQNQIWKTQAGGNRQGLNFEQIRGFSIPLPPLAEQRRIAAVLGTWDEAIRLVGELIAALKQRKQGLMQRLLTGEMRFPGFTGEWEGRKLNAVMSVNYGKSPTAIYDEHGSYPIYGTSGVLGYTNHVLYDGDAIIVGRKGTIDSPQQVSGQFWATDTTFVCIPNNDIDVTWLYFVLHHEQLEQYNEASTLPSLSRNTLQEIQVSVPPFAEQEKIGEILHACDIHIHLLVQQRTQYQRQKRGLMQQLLTGAVRLAGDEATHS